MHIFLAPELHLRHFVCLLCIICRASFKYNSCCETPKHKTSRLANHFNFEKMCVQYKIYLVDSQSALFVARDAIGSAVASQFVVSSFMGG